MIQKDCEVGMEFVKFEKHINTIKNTLEKEKEVSDCIQKNLSTSTYCIVDISNEVIDSIIELLADYYDCYFDLLNSKSNDISWWLFESVNKVITIIDHKKEKEEKIIVEDIHSFWEYLEDNRNRKIKEGTYRGI